MSNSSPLTDYSITSDNVDTITISSSTVDLSSYGTSTLSSYSYSNSGLNTITIGPITTASIDASTFSIGSLVTPTEWKDCFPYWERVQSMCKEYPALKIALRNFQTVYELVKDDYDNPAPKK